MPLTADTDTWLRAVECGREVIWLHTFGNRFRQSGCVWPIVIPAHLNPLIDEAIPVDAQTLEHDPVRCRLLVRGLSGEATGVISNITSAVRDYTVVQMNVIDSWFKFRRAKPGGKRNSPLDDVGVGKWAPAYNKELLDILRILTRLVSLRSTQDSILQEVLNGPLIGTSDLTAASVLPVSKAERKPPPPFKKPPSQKLPLAIKAPSGSKVPRLDARTPKQAATDVSTP